MLVSPRLLAIAAVFASTPALADLSNISAITFISNAATTEQHGKSSSGTEFAMPFFLTTLGSLDESHMSAASIPTTDVLSTTQATGAFTADSQSLQMSLDSSVHSTLDARNGGTTSVIRSRVATSVRFTTDESVRVTLSGDATIETMLRNLLSPSLPQTTFSLSAVSDPTNPFLFVEDFENAFDHQFILGPGSYQLLAAADASLETFGFPQGLYYLESDLNYTFLIEPIPAPAATLLFPLAAAFSTRRRRVLIA